MIQWDMVVIFLNIILYHFIKYFNIKNIGYNASKVFKLHTFTLVNQFQIHFHVSMIYYEFFI